ncbi:hypothetical protein CRG98_025721 [Punica granatum]|uniref:Reverse transcriptase Ty1/copia-type domain-containing protein n=1 Tax=Punica granatum TaxID=22663 RepID=A0A2I0JCG3_PUNGR|nr:hypothetical protein CRG98_025721 [Punica granatum]
MNKRNISQEVVLRRSERVSFLPKHLKDFIVHTARHENPSPSPSTSLNSSSMFYTIQRFIDYSNVSKHHKVFLAAIDFNKEPTTYREAVWDQRWRTAMAEEVRALELNNTWMIEQLPSGKRPIGCKWVYKVKHRADRSIERYKARLVAKGFTQVEGVDYHETFAQVAKLVTVRCLLTVAVAKGWHIHQMDVNNTFLHGDLDEEVYMELPPSFSISRNGNVCRLRKSLYGPRQASRNWFSKFADALRQYGFIQLGADHSLFTFTRSDVFLGVLVRLIGRLIYLTITKKEISYSLHILAQFMQAPRQDHWDAAMWVLRYLKQSPSKGIFLRPPSLKLEAFCYSDWASCLLTRRSVTGYFIMLGGCPISWKMKEQTTVSHSSAKAEY